MTDFGNMIAALKTEFMRLHERHESARFITPDFYDPGKMEYPEQSDCVISEDNVVTASFELMGTRYDGRTELIELINAGDELKLIREEDNQFNPNNFTVENADGRNLGNMPAVLCNVLAPLYDAGHIQIEDMHVSFVDPVSARSRYATKGILFASLKFRILDTQE